MKLLIIPDVHQRHEQVQRALDREHDVDWTVFLGDFFDDWDDTVWDAVETSKWLKDLLDRPKTSVLMGNHDLHYAWPRTFLSSGFSWEKYRAINEVLSHRDWLKFSSYVDTGSWLLTHAGLSEPFTIKGLGEAFVDMKVNGVGRGPIFGENGPFWVRPWALMPILGRNQVFGHTEQDREPMVKMTKAGAKLLNLDTRGGKYYALLDTGTDKVEILKQ